MIMYLILEAIFKDILKSSLAFQIGTPIFWPQFQKN